MKSATVTTKPRKASSKAKEKDQNTANLSKKLSLALEKTLNEAKTTNPIGDLPDNDPLQSMQEQRKASVLEKAKALIERSKTMNSYTNNNRKYKSFVPKDDAFLTSIAVLSENRPKKRKESPENGENDNPEPDQNDDDMLKNLMLDNTSEYDDLAELRKMINRTKKNISDYASELYQLKNNVNDVKVAYEDLGYSIKNNDVIDEMESFYSKVMPGGDRNKLFKYEFYDNPEREKERFEAKSAKKKTGSGAGVGKKKK